MPLDESFYFRSIKIFKDAFREIFSDTAVLKEEYCNFEFMGNFKLVYVYVPLDYSIIIENELTTFTITLEDSDQANTNLYRIKQFDNQLCEKNIIHSLNVLKNVLLENKFDLYMWKDSKLYRKNAEGLKRIKDIKEILNEQSGCN